MQPETPAAAPVAAPTDLPTDTTAAPRRERRLVPTAPRSKPARPAARLSPKAAAASPAPVKTSAVESKVAALQDPEEILNLIRTEATLRRARRLSGAGDAQRQTIRLLSVCMLFALLAAAVGAMWYLQTSLQGSHRARRPVPSAPAVQPR